MFSALNIYRGIRTPAPRSCAVKRPKKRKPSNKEKTWQTLGIDGNSPGHRTFPVGSAGRCSTPRAPSPPATAASLPLSERQPCAPRIFLAIALADLASDAAPGRSPDCVTRCSSNPAEKGIPQFSLQSLLASLYPYVKAVSYRPAALFLAAAEVLVFWCCSQWIQISPFLSMQLKT